MLLPHKVDMFFREQDFAAIYEHLHLWLWTFRVHLFGIVITVMALIGLATLLNDTRSSVVAWPGSIVANRGCYGWSILLSFRSVGCYRASRAVTASPHSDD